MNKTILLPVVAAVAAGSIAMASATAFAQTATEISTYPPIVTKIAERFGLNADEVKAVFDEEHEVRESEMKTRLEERLNAAVAAGELTEEQKQLILNKQAELRENMESVRANFQNMTEEERRAAMQQKQAELRTWAEENGIDMKYLMMKMRLGGGPGQGDMMRVRTN